MPERPYLEQLENLRVDCASGCLAAWSALPLFAGFVLWRVTGWSVWVGLVFALAVLFAVVAGSGDSCRIVCDAQGISFRRFFRTRRIAWTDITKSERVWDEEDCSRWFRVESSDYSFYRFIDEPDAALLQASISQHLRQHGRPGMPLGRIALTLWTEIPDSIPAEMELDYQVGRDGDIGPSHFELRSDCLSQLITGRKKANDQPVKRRVNPIVINWSEVTGARWRSFDEQQWTSLVIRSGPKLEIEIPLSRKSRDSARFALGVIRRLRELERVGPLPFPPRLIKQSGTERQTTGGDD